MVANLPTLVKLMYIYTVQLPQASYASHAAALLGVLVSGCLYDLCITALLQANRAAREMVSDSAAEEEGGQELLEVEAPPAQAETEVRILWLQCVPSSFDVCVQLCCFAEDEQMHPWMFW